MYRRELERHLRAHGCALLREGARHSMWQNTATGALATIPRHREIRRTVARSICDQLGIPRIDRR